MVAMTYIYAKQDLTFLENPGTQTLLKAFLRAMYSDDYATRKSILIVSYDVQRFVDSIVCSYGERDTIICFMLYDKLGVQRPWSNVLRLEHLCQKTICSYGDKLRNDSSFKMQKCNTTIN